MFGRFGDAPRIYRAEATVKQVADQRQALRLLAELTARSISHQLVFSTAIQITRKCPSRDDACELEAIFAAIKTGDPDVPPLMNGFRYVADPRLFDRFTSPVKNLEMGITAAQGGGAAAGDCDDHASLNAALAAAVGFKTGLRAWGKLGQDYEHVFAVAGLPKRAPTQWYAMDTTVDHAYVGWEPPPGNVLTAVIDDGGVVFNGRRR